MKHSLIALMTGVSLIALTGAAKADVWIGYRTSLLDPIVTIASGASTAGFIGSLGFPFVSNLIAATNLADPLAATALDVSIDATNAFLQIVVSSTDQSITNDTGSSFAVNTLQPGWTVTESTYGNVSNLPYAMETLIGTATFVGLGAATDGSPASPYASLTATFDIFTGPTSPSGSFLGTIKVAELQPRTVPEPGSLALLGGFLTALGLTFRRRQGLSNA